MSSRTASSVVSTLYGSIAPPFPTSETRAAVLSHEAEGHYYGRFSHPTTEGLVNHYRRLLDVENVRLVRSGLAASIVALKSLVPPGGTIIFDSKIYYEVHRSILAAGADLKWNAVMCDMTDPGNLEKVLAGNGGTSVVDADSPSNWFVNVLDIEAISKVAHQHRGCRDV